MAHMVRFVEGTQVVKNNRITVGWWVVWILAAVLFGLFIAEPTWFIVPPFVHNYQIQL